MAMFMEVLVEDNYSNKGKTKFYDLMDKTRREIAGFQISDEEKSRLYKIVDETTRNYERDRINHVNRIVQNYRKELVETIKVLDDNRSLFN